MLFEKLWICNVLHNFNKYLTYYTKDIISSHLTNKFCVSSENGFKNILNETRCHKKMGPYSSVPTPSSWISLTQPNQNANLLRSLSGLTERTCLARKAHFIRPSTSPRNQTRWHSRFIKISFSSGLGGPGRISPDLFNITRWKINFEFFV